jgi:hypothetical protein
MKADKAYQDLVERLNADIGDQRKLLLQALKDLVDELDDIRSRLLYLEDKEK